MNSGPSLDDLWASAPTATRAWLTDVSNLPVAVDEATFHGYTIPTRLRVGWHFVNGQFESDGEFFRVSVDDAVFR